MNPARLKAYFELLIAVVIWGVAASVIKFGLNEMPPFTFLAYRYLLTSVLLLPFFIKAGGKLLILKNLPIIVFVSLLGSTLNQALLFYGGNLSSSVDLSLITATAPIIIIWAGAVFLREHITKKEKVGIAITLLGTGVIILQSLFEGSGTAKSSILGNILLFGSNFIFAAYLILSKKAVRKEIDPFSLTFMTFLVGFFTILPLTYTETHTLNLIPVIMKLSLSAHLSVFYMAVFSGAIAYFLYQKAQKTIEASEASVFQYLQPVVTAPVAVLWLGEKITIPMIVGSVIVAIGVLLAEIKKKRGNNF